MATKKNTKSFIVKAASYSDDGSASLPMLEYGGEKATYFADLNTVYNDLNFVHDALKTLGSSKTTDRFSVRELALWKSALVTYRRNFLAISGKGRFRLSDKDVKSLKNKDYDRVHQLALETATRQLAHKQNTDEQDKIVIILNPKPARSIATVSYLNIRRVSEDPKDRGLLVELVQCLIKQLEPQVQSAQSDLLETAKNQPIDELYDLVSTD
jgi:hypothetical protein